MSHKIENKPIQVEVVNDDFTTVQVNENNVAIIVNPNEQDWIYGEYMRIHRKRIRAVSSVASGSSPGGGSEPPTVQASSLLVVDTDDDNQDLTVVRGNGNNILVVRNVIPVWFVPVEDTIYTLGENLGNGHVVAYVGSSNSFNVASLSEDTDYYYSAFEFNASGSLRKYLTTNSPTAHLRTMISEYHNLETTGSGTAPTVLMEKMVNNEIVRDIVNGGVFAAADVVLLYQLFGDDVFKLNDVKNIGRSATRVNSPTTAEREGYTGDSANNRYINTFNTSSYLQYTLSDAAIFMYVRGNIAEAGTILGIFENSRGIYFIPRSAVGNVLFQINDNTVTSFANPVDNSEGLWLLKRNGSNKQARRNWAIIFDGTVAAAGVPSGVVCNLAHSLSGTPGSVTNRGLDCYIVMKQSTVPSFDQLATAWANHKYRMQTVQTASRQMGILYGKNNWTDLSDFTISGNNVFSVSGGQIVLTGDGGTPGFLNLTGYYSALEQYRMVVEWTQVGTQRPFELGGNTTNDTFVVSNFGSVLGSESGGNAGRPRNVCSLLTTVIGTSGVTLSNGSTYRLTVEYDAINFVVKVERTSSTYQVATLRLNPNNVVDSLDAQGLVNTFIPCIKSGPGGAQISLFKFETDLFDRPSSMFVGDSISWGSGAGDPEIRFAKILGGMIHAGPGDKTREILLRLPEIIRINPTKVYLFIGTNDRSRGVSLATFQTNYASIVTQLESAGITVVKLLISPADGYDVTSFNSWISSTYPGEVIDMYTPFWSGVGTGIDATYSGDGLHFNRAGQILAASTIQSSGL